MANLFRIKGFPPYISMIFLNAFVDLGHKITVQNTVFKTYEGDALIILTATVNALILLPYILLFTPCGFMSDKYPKNRVMLASAWAAVGLTMLITLFYHLGWFWAAFAMTFLLAVQSAFYSPAKYGYIKEIAGREHLAQANGLVQATTTVAILAGTFAFSVLFEMYLANVSFSTRTDVLRAIAPIGWFLVAGAVAELLLAYRMPTLHETDQSLHFDWGRYRRGQYLVNNMKAVKSNEVIILSILGLAIFWAIGQVMLAAFPAFVKENLGVLDARIVQGMLACAGIGIMAGSVIAGRISKNYIETGLIPVGSAGVAVCLFILPGLESAPAHGLNILLLGLLGGMFIIPLNALIQFHAGEQVLGRVLAGNNLVQNTIMLSFLALTVALSLLELSRLLFPLLTVAALAGSCYTVYRLPQSLARFIIAWVLGLRYRVEVLGFRNIPESGGVLMLGDQASQVDWAVIQMASPRPVRFVLDPGRYRRRSLKRLLGMFGVIPVAGAAADVDAALRVALEHAAAGQVMCLPAAGESQRRRLLQLRRDAASGVAGAAAALLPFHLRGPWREEGAAPGGPGRTARGRGDIVVSFARPLPMDATVEQVEQALQSLARGERRD